MVLVQRVGSALVVGVGEACAPGPEDLLPVESHTHDYIGRYRTRDGSPRRSARSGGIELAGDPKTIAQDLSPSCLVDR